MTSAIPTLRPMLKSAAISAILFSCLGLNAAFAQQMVSIGGHSVNMRDGPSTSAQARWQLESGYPLKVIGQRGTWLKVTDFEGDQGWVSRRLTGAVPHHVVKSSRANLRSGPGTQYRLLSHASYGDVFRTLEKRRSWVRVASVDDGRKGWIARGLLWGW